MKHGYVADRLVYSCQVDGGLCSLPGIVKQDPVLPDDVPLPPPPPRAKSAIFEDEEKSKVEGKKLKPFFTRFINKNDRSIDHTQLTVPVL